MISCFADIHARSNLCKTMASFRYKVKANGSMLVSGRFNLPRFTKLQNYLLESLYSISDLHNPSAYRLYLYLIRNITGYQGRGSIEFNRKKIMKDLNMGNSFYRAIDRLIEKDMIYKKRKQDGTEYLRINVYPDTWKTSKDIDKQYLEKIVKNEVDAIKGIEKDAINIHHSRDSRDTQPTTEGNNTEMNKEDTYEGLPEGYTDADLFRKLDEM